MKSLLRRRWKIGFSVLFGSILLFSFQNCGLSTQCNSNEKEGECAASPSESNGGASQTGSGLGTSLPSGSPSSPNRSSNSAILGGVNGSPNNLSSSPTGAVLGGGSGSSTGGGGGTTSGSSTQLGGGSIPGSEGVSNSKVFKFAVTLPTSKSVDWFGFGSIEAPVTGGTPPYKYQWYKNSEILISKNAGYGFSCSTDYSCQLDASSYSTEGRYHVVVKDSSTPAKSITSPIVSVSIADPPGNCEANSYVMHDGSGGVSQFSELFRNIRGVYIINANNDSVNYMLSYPKYFGITVIQSMPQAAFQQRIDFPSLCSGNIPGINAAVPNPGSSRYSGDGDFSCFYSSDTDGCGYRRVGAVTLECRNNRWRLVSNTCGWQAVTQTSGANNNPGFQSDN